MLDVYSHIFGISFVDSKKNVPTWHEDVNPYAVWNDEEEGGEFLGYLYFDLHPREAKDSHGGHYCLSPGYTKTDGTRHFPSSAIVLNFTTPTAKKPTLLTHDNIRKLFHELGHGLHSILSRTNYARFHGTSVDRDFVEAPCMMFENFFWTFRHMKDLSYHYSQISPTYEESWRKGLSEDLRTQEMPEKLDAETITDLVSKREHETALQTLFLIQQSTYDMTIHGQPSREALESLDLAEIFVRLRRDITGISGGEALRGKRELGNGQTAFRALVNGYDSGYYTYLVGRIYSFDIFYTGFKADTMSKKAGRRYRYTVLESGGSQDGLKILRDYLGREPSATALCQELGIDIS